MESISPEVAEVSKCVGPDVKGRHSCSDQSKPPVVQEIFGRGLTICGGKESNTLGFVHESMTWII